MLNSVRIRIDVEKKFSKIIKKFLRNNNRNSNYYYYYSWSSRRCSASCESAATLCSCCFTVHMSICCRHSVTARSRPSTMFSD